jgi:pimeloyl-ACP methyl ester carboxylesterase/DNA-binding CsgD family transcriptional regulator
VTGSAWQRDGDPSAVAVHLPYDDAVDQQIRFCTSRDGTRIAFAAHGSGTPIVRASTWLTHLELDWSSPLYRHWLADLGREHRFVRYDERGCGLSDREVTRFSLDAWTEDLEAVVDAAGLDRFALLGISGGGPTSIAYAARHPDRVSHLILYGAYGHGRSRRPGVPDARAEADALTAAVRVGWGRANPAFRRLFTTLFVPDATQEQMEWLDETQRLSASPETAVRIREARGELDVTGLAPLVAAPTIVFHARDDAASPFEEGRQLASLIPTARLVPLEGRNHILLASDPGWPVLLAELRAFLAPAPRPVGPEPSNLTSRELEVLALVADGLDNAEIARRLYLSPRTVERHLSNVYDKLGVSGKAARAAAAARFSRLAGTASGKPRS